MIKRYKAFLENIIQPDLPTKQEMEDYIQVLVDMEPTFNSLEYYVLDENNEIGVSDISVLEEGETPIGYCVYLTYKNIKQTQEINKLLANVLFNIRSDVSKYYEIYYEFDKTPGSGTLIHNMIIMILKKGCVNMFSKSAISGLKLYTGSMLESVSQNNELPTIDEVKDYMQILEDEFESKPDIYVYTTIRNRAMEAEQVIQFGIAHALFTGYQFLYQYKNLYHLNEYMNSLKHISNNISLDYNDISIYFYAVATSATTSQIAINIMRPSIFKQLKDLPFHTYKYDSTQNEFININNNNKFDVKLYGVGQSPKSI